MTNHILVDDLALENKVVVSFCLWLEMKNGKLFARNLRSTRGEVYLCPRARMKEKTFDDIRPDP